MKLDGPARMLAILDAQAIDDLRCHAGKAADIAAQAILQGGNRVVGAARGVVPAFQRRHGKREIEAGGRIAPGLGGQRLQGAAQSAGRRRRGQQGADDREAQPRPAIAFVWIGYCVQNGLPMRRRRRQRDWEPAYKPSRYLAIGNLCVLCGTTLQRDHCRTVKGMRKASSRIIDSATAPVKRAIRLVGS